MTIQYLKKKGGARLKHVDTYKVICDDTSKFSCITSFMNGHESNSGNNEFSHIALAKYNKKDKFVIKVLSSECVYLQREIEILKTLQTYKHVVQYICHISCNDNRPRWIKNIDKPITPCSQGKDPLTFIVMEYIENGGISEFLESSPTLQEIKSIFFQTTYILMELGFTYKIHHGDINSGNILLKNTKINKTLTFNILGEIYKVESQGFRVVLIDFGRGYFYSNHSQKSILVNVFEEIVAAFDIYTRYISNTKLKKKIKAILQEYMVSKKIYNISDFLDMVESMFYLIIPGTNEYGSKNLN